MPKIHSRTPSPYLHRRRWSADDARAALADLDASGLDLAAFAAAAGLDPQRLTRWRRRLGTLATFEEVVAVLPQRRTTEILARVEQHEWFEVVLASGRKGVHPGRAALPAHLPRVPDINLVPPEKRICPVCGQEMKTVGFDDCERLEVRPAEIFVLARRDERVSCPRHHAIVSAEAPPQIVERGKLGDVLIVEGLCDKYLEHQPIERQCRKFNRAGVDLPPNTLGRSVAACIDLLAPIARAI